MHAHNTEPPKHSHDGQTAASDGKKSGLAYWAERALEEAEKASHDFAPDPVHDLRVAIRRCRSLADGFLSIDPDPAWRQMKKLGKTLFASLGDLRDTQVMMEWIEKLSEEDDPLRNALLLSLRRREESLKVLAREAVNNFDGQQWLELNRALAERATKIPLEGPVFQYLALERWHEAHELHRAAIRNRSAVAYHALRIGIKRFRYTVENFLPERHKRWSRDLRDLQDALGEVHDFDVLWAMVRTHPEFGADERALWQGIISTEREKRIALYRKKMMGRDSLWRKWREELPSGSQLAEAAMERMRTWAAFRDPENKHAQLVTRTALQIYDALVREGLLPSSEGARQALEAAAVMHDLGGGKDGGGKKRGLRMMRGLSTTAGWSEDYLQSVAIVAHYHRGPLPASNHPIFAGLPVQRRTELLPLAGVLRLANALDAANDQRVMGVALEKKEDYLLLSVQGLSTVASPQGERIARAKYLLETCVRKPIIVRAQQQRKIAPA